MATIKYTIKSGAAPYTVELTPILIPINYHESGGTYEFINVPDGSYVFIVTDANECVFQQELTVNPFVTTTTTTLTPGNSIVVGNTDDEMLIFNENATNREDHYIGYPDANVVTLYLWFKTFDGKPLSENMLFYYTIAANSGSTFNFVDVSDQKHVEVTQTIGGFAPSISGQVLLKVGFIESYFQYTYIKNPTIPNYSVELSRVGIEWLDDKLGLVNDTNIYGVTYIDRDNVIMEF